MNSTLTRHAKSWVCRREGWLPQGLNWTRMLKMILISINLARNIKIKLICFLNIRNLVTFPLKLWKNIPDFINESTLVYTVTCNSGTEKINQYYIDDFQHGMTVTLYGKTTYYFFTYPAGSSRLEWFKINSNGKLEELLARQRDAELEVLAPHLYEWMREGENTWIHGNDVAYKNDCVEIKE
ncbi:MAG: hypothetical protein HYT27_01225 [Parcubacteria group bacterium]|nr:hypothetical protein [Parcubacteria group bacterium]